VKYDTQGFLITVDADWLRASPLTAAALEDERHQWEMLGMALRIRQRRD
jgi:hypothetical protein